MKSWRFQPYLWYVCLSGVLWSCQETPEPVNAPVKEPVEQVANIKYGLDLDKYTVKYDTVQRNWTLSHLLLPQGISQQQVNTFAELAKDSAVNLKYIQAGKPCCFLYDEDTVPAFCVYERNRKDYVVFQVQDSLQVYSGERPVVSQEKVAFGRIDYSLWQSIHDQGLPLELTNKLANIYAWTIDFFGIQPGDAYHVVYEELSIDDKAIGIGQVKAANFYHAGADHYAFFHENDTTRGYFDEKGSNLRKALLQAPLQYTRISSHFSHSRLHPVLKKRRPHYGVDYAAPIGTPVVTVGDGVVTFAGTSGGAGKMIKIKHNHNLETKYLHLSKFEKGIRKGARVVQGQKIGEVGNTGLSTGPHLDFRLYMNGKPLNPLKADIPSGDPLPAQEQTRFFEKVPTLKEQLDKLKHYEELSESA